MLVRAQSGRLAGCAQLESMVLAAIASALFENAATYDLCRSNRLMDSHDGHDSIQALF
jgi:hypothetical protein